MQTLSDKKLDPPPLHHYLKNPIALLGLLAVLALRAFYGLFFFFAGFNKVLKSWDNELVTGMFAQRLTELNPDSFAYVYLEKFAIPLAGPIYFIVTYGELFAGLGLVLGIATRSSAIIAFFILLNIAIGGYFAASLIPFFAMNALIIAYPMGHIIGLDRYLIKRFPNSWLFQ